jgi:hypothetical protein
MANVSGRLRQVTNFVLRGGMMLSKRLCFELKMGGEMVAIGDIFQRFMPSGQTVLNRTEWRGKEPRSCAVTSINTPPRSTGSAGPTVIQIEVTYRPKGYISYTGYTRYDGWTATVLDRTSDPPTYVSREVYEDVEFNNLDFGQFVGELDVEGVKHVTADAVMKEVMGSGSLSVGITGSLISFIAPHRSRPQKKIILSGNPTGEFVDGFGTHILNINNSTPNLELVLMDTLTQLMCEFIEGKASIKTLGNDDIAFVELSDSLVDCAPNEDGLDSLFDILHLQTPADFLEELAKRLMSVYLVEAAVVDGEKSGLVLRRERSK